MLNSPIKKAQIKLIDPNLPFPAYQTEGSAAFDLYSRLEVIVPAQKVARIPLNVVIIPPPGYWSLLAVRSSLHKIGLLPANGIGIMDPDFVGEEDEYQLLVFNYTSEPVTVKRGDRLAQVTFVPMIQVDLEATRFVKAKSRGGIGSTNLQAQS